MKLHPQIQYSIFSLLFLATTANAKALTLRDCGAVVGHEMGLWEFFTPTPNPHQVERALKSDLNFFKVSLRKLKDGVWVVHHDPSIAIYPTLTTSKRVILDQLTWKDVEELKADPIARIPIYRLEEYLEKDQGRLCWMFTPKVSPDNNLVQILLKYNIAHRSILTTGGLTDVKFLASYPEELGLNFAGRVGSSENELEAFGPYLRRLWAMEIDPTPRTKPMIDAVHNLGLRAYVDSMRFSKSYEFLGSACNKVFAMGADITQTNRPGDCKKKMGALLPPYILND
jgi:glycerophosphoryl diester phosphodiesterase